MSACDTVRPLLVRLAEGEASPEQAMITARHLPGCTACRILLARERRLIQALEEGLEDLLPVGEDFVETVMSRLPDGPPRREDRRRRSLKLA